MRQFSLLACLGFLFLAVSFVQAQDEGAEGAEGAEEKGEECEEAWEYVEFMKASIK